MNVFGAFELSIGPSTPDDPAGVRIALQKATFDPNGRVFVTAECSSFEELEAQSTPCRTNWTRSAREHGKRFK